MFCPPFKSCRLYKEVYLKSLKDTNNIQKKNIIWDEPFTKVQPYGMNLNFFKEIHLPTIFYAPKFLPP
jgi:hypothetical protein